MKKHPKGHSTLSLSLCVLLAASAAWGEETEAEEAPTGWHDVAEVSYVATGGNAEAETLSLRNTLSREWDKALLTIEAAALRAENTSTSRVAVAGATSFVIEETSVSQLTAENYLLRARYQADVSERRYWFVSAGWDRNEFAGIQNRLVAAAGLGNVWFDNDDAKFQTDYGLTFTDQEDLVGGSESFAGAQLGWDYSRKLTPTTRYVNRLIVDASLDETSNYRVDNVNALSVSMSERLALKVSLQLLYDNLPSLTEVPLVGSDGQPSGNTVLVPLDELDTLFNVALVVNF